MLKSGFQLRVIERPPFSIVLPPAVAEPLQLKDSEGSSPARSFSLVSLSLLLQVVPLLCSIISWPVAPPQAILSSSQAESLIAPVRVEEMRQALLSMAKNQAPGIDGITSSFFKGYWNTTGPDLILAVLHFFETGHMSQRWKDTVVVLVPKIPGAHMPSHFRPMSLELFTRWLQRF